MQRCLWVLWFPPVTAWRSLLLPGALAVALSSSAQRAGADGGTNRGSVEVVLNGLKIVVDGDSGGLLRLSSEATGELLAASRDRAGMVDVAFPLPEFEPLRLASRYSHGARVTASEKAVEIEWDRLGTSRAGFSVVGAVSARVRFEAAPDGRSVILSGTVRNQSTRPVPQVLFPDLAGLRPIAGAENTFFRSSLSVSRPFVELAPTEETLSEPYMTERASFCAEYQTGGLTSTMGLRWLDLGGLRGGLSLFARRWGWDPPMTVRLHLSEVEQKLRLLCRNDLSLAPGETWESGQFVLTPHAGGWAKGIEPFRDWVRQQYRREFPVPRRVREGLGYRTVWMSQTQAADERDAIFTFRDLPALARESLAHGLDEMVLWAWVKPFQSPLPPPLPRLGTEPDLVRAVQECRRLGVSVAPFISVVQATAATASRYGVQVTGNQGWTYHTELVPRRNPPYASALASVTVPTSNQLWQAEVLQSCRRLVDLGVPCLSWDQYWTTTAALPNMQSLTRQIREYARQRDPEATFSGEELWNLEIDSGYLDHTWNWLPYRDCRALTSVLPAPRVNVCVSRSPLTAKKAFADNLYLNVLPRKPESVNGSDWITNQPALGRALQQCAARRRQFLRYFTEGTLIGDGVLTEPCPQAHVTAYVLADRLLLVLINEGATRRVSFRADLAAWLPRAREDIHITVFDANGRRIRQSSLSRPLWRETTPSLGTGDMLFYEISSGQPP